jgi:hypothetical protein
MHESLSLKDLYLMLYVYVVSFNVAENLEKFLIFE